MTVGTPTNNGVRTRQYRDGRLERENFPIESISEYLREPHTTVWIDLCSPDSGAFQIVANELGLHNLAIEDAVNPRQRPKQDRYASHDFLNVYATNLDTTTGEVRLSELAAFVTPATLVTVRKDNAFDIDDVVARWDSSTHLVEHRVEYLLYGLLDYVVDGHFEAVQELENETDELEDLLFDERSRDTDIQRRGFELRKNLITRRRVVLPMREVVTAFMHREIAAVADEMTPYYQDLHDHVLRASEWTESLRDLITSILETNLTIQGNWLNIITEKVTSWAAVIAVPTAITGFYGQNLPYPGFSATSGLITSSLLIIVLSVSLYLVFRHKDWL